MRRFILTGLLLVAAPIAAQSSDLDPASPAGDPVSLPGTHRFLVTPVHGGDPYEVRVALPLSYAAAPESRYPVLYATYSEAPPIRRGEWTACWGGQRR